MTTDYIEEVPAYNEIVSKLDRQDPVALGFVKPNSSERATVYIRLGAIHVVDSEIRAFPGCDRKNYTKVIGELLARGFIYECRYR